jgi:hypothetical protein
MQGIENEEKAEVIRSKSAPLALGEHRVAVVQKWLAAHFLFADLSFYLAHCHNFLPDSILLGSGLLGARSSLWTLVLSARVALC